MIIDNTEISRQLALEQIRTRKDLLLTIYAFLEDLENAVERNDPEAAAMIVKSMGHFFKNYHD
jgi:hypothetical protein